MAKKDKKFIQKAIKKPGSLRKSLGIEKGKKIPASKLKAAAKKPGKLGQRARFAITLGKLRKKYEDTWQKKTISFLHSQSM